MSEGSTTETATVLMVDDEVNILHALKRAVRRESYRVLMASSGTEGLEILKKEHVDLIISDQRMPEMTGVHFLSKVKELYPDTIRIILSGYTDINSITEAINYGNVYKFLLKPWEDEALKSTIRESLELARLQKENKTLTETIKCQNEELRYLNQNLEKVVEERTTEIKWQNEALKLVRDLLESLPVAVIGTGNDGMIVFANGLARDFFDAPEKPLYTSRLKKHFGEDLLEMVFGALNIEEQKNLKYLHSDGSLYDVSCVPLSRKNLEIPRKGAVISFYKIIESGS